MKHWFGIIIGILFFFTSIFSFWQISSEESQAKKRDTKKTINAVISEDTPPSCIWNTDLPSRIMSENTSQAIVIQTSNTSSKPCETYLSLRAPGFDVEPSNDEQKIILQPNSMGSISWIIVPRKTGDFDISLSDIINTKTFGISVTNMFGLNAIQAKIASIIGSLFGPMFTIPWWWDRLRKKKSAV